MANIQFEDEIDNKKTKEDYGKMVNFIRDTLNVSGEIAKKIFVGVGVVALLVSLYFWFQLL